MGNQGQAETGSDKGEKVRHRGPLVSKVRGKGERGVTGAFPGELLEGKGHRVIQIEFPGLQNWNSQGAVSSGQKRLYEGAGEAGICISAWDMHWGGWTLKTNLEVGRQRAF